VKQRNNLTSMFHGFRIVRKRIEGKVRAVPQMPKIILTRNLLKIFEKATILTKIQYNIIKEQIEKCTEKNSSPEYVARLDSLLEKFPIEEPTKEK
jgi:hypothetical protein